MIKNDNENSDLITRQARKLKSRSFASYMDITILAMVAILIVAIVCTFFGEIVFGGEIDWAEISASTVTISACTIAIYLLLRSYSMRKGRKTEVWINSFDRQKELSRRILQEDKAKYITQYCRAWEAERLDYDIEDVIAPVGIKLEDYKDKYVLFNKRELKERFKELTDYQISAILKAKKIKRLKFDERYFYSGSHRAGKRRAPSSEIGTRQLNRIANARIIISTVVTMLLSTTLMWDVIFNFTWEAFIKCVIKIAIICVFGAVGMLGGYTFVTVNEVDEANAKSDELVIFLKWCDNLKEKAV